MRPRAPEDKNGFIHLTFYAPSFEKDAANRHWGQWEIGIEGAKSISAMTFSVTERGKSGARIAGKVLLAIIKVIFRIRL
jgi:hypothetical protein